jgi:hypothetical protein
VCLPFRDFCSREDTVSRASGFPEPLSVLVHSERDHSLSHPPLHISDAYHQKHTSHHRCPTLGSQREPGKPRPVPTRERPRNAKQESSTPLVNRRARPARGRVQARNTSVPPAKEGSRGRVENVSRSSSNAFLISVRNTRMYDPPTSERPDRKQGLQDRHDLVPE